MFGIYIHVPFCQKKCFYCDFYSIENLSLFDKYIEALCREIEMKIKSLDQVPMVDSIFFGGGTPSLLKPEQLEKIVGTLKNNFDIKEDAEWTLEANPGTIGVVKLEEFRKIGINRLSIGVQSFNDDELSFLQRIHNAKQAEQGIKEAVEAGFGNFSIDLIFSIPSQTIEKVKNTIAQTLSLRPNHISAYSLIYEQGTPLYNDFISGKVKKIEDDFDAEIYHFICESLINAGYEHYEVSNFAMPGYQCIHNINYWNGGEYLAFGPSGHGYFNGERYWNFRSLKKYYELIKSNQLPTEGSEALNKIDLINESVMLGLRAGGIDFNEFHKKFGLKLELLAGDLFDDWEKEGFCSYNKNKVKLNHKGYFICDVLVNQLLKMIDKYS